MPTKQKQLTKALAALQKIQVQLLDVIDSLSIIDSREEVIETAARPGLGLGKKRRRTG